MLAPMERWVFPHRLCGIEGSRHILPLVLKESYNDCGRYTGWAVRVVSGPHPAVSGSKAI